MLSDEDREELDAAIQAADDGEDVLVWTQFGQIHIQAEEGAPSVLESSPESIIAYLIGGTVGEPEEGEADDQLWLILAGSPGVVVKEEANDPDTLKHNAQIYARQYQAVIRAAPLKGSVTKILAFPREKDLKKDS